MRTFIKNCYSIYLTLYLLWWVSAVIIISEEGFNFVQDVPWFLLFTAVLLVFWAIKYFLANDSKIVFHNDISLLNRNAHLIVIIAMTLLMVIYS
jgi:hypothetical protein